MKKDLILILVCSLLIKLIYVLFSIGLHDYIGKEEKLNYFAVIDVFKKNDAFWYEHIAVNGYSQIEDVKDLGYNDGSEYKQSEWAFFPFYPLLIYVTHKLTNLNIDSSFLLLSFIFSALGFIIFYLLTRDLYGDKRKALWFTLLLIIFPFHYYFSVFYTEAVFLSCLVGAFYAILKRKYLIMSLLLIPLVLTRPNGILLLVPLYFFMLEQENLLVNTKLKGIFKRQNVYRSIYFATGPAIFIIYCLYQKHMTGEYFAFSIAQEGWYRKFMFPLLAFFRHGDMATQFNSVYTILFIILAIFAWKRIPLSFNILIWISLLLPLTSGSVMSMPRFISLIFPMIIFIGLQLYKLKMRWIVYVLLFFLQLCSLYFWVINHPLGY